MNLKEPVGKKLNLPIELTFGSFSCCRALLNYYGEFEMPMSSITDSSREFESEVDLVNFSVIASDKVVELKWTTSKEVGNIGFSIERKFMDDKKWEQIGFAPSKGEFYSQHEYNYQDVPGVTGLLSYRLKQTGADGADYYSMIVSLTIKKYENIVLYQNYPDPFINSTNILFQLPENITGQVVVKIQNVQGKDVRRLYDNPVKPGYYNIEWNSCDEEGKPVSPGIYTCILETESQQFNKKIMKLSYKPKVH